MRATCVSAAFSRRHNGIFLFIAATVLYKHAARYEVLIHHVRTRVCEPRAAVRGSSRTGAEFSHCTWQGTIENIRFYCQLMFHQEKVLRFSLSTDTPLLLLLTPPAKETQTQAREEDKARCAGCQTDQLHLFHAGHL